MDMTTIQNGLMEALNISMAKADEALERKDYEAHQTWTDWSVNLLKALKRYSADQSQAWDEGHSWGWSDAQEAHDVRQDMAREDWSLKTPNPYRTDQ